MALTVLPLYQQRVEQKMAAMLHARANTDAELLQAMQYSLLSGGKRIRPFLVYSCGQMLGASGWKIWMLRRWHWSVCILTR